MPFQFETPHDNTVGTIAELMQEPARARAAAVIASGQAWGNAAQNIGNTVSGTINSFVDPRMQAQRLQVKSLQDAEKTKAVFEAALKDPANYRPDGTVDDAKVTNVLKKNDIAAWQQWQSIASAMQKHALDMQKTIADINATNTTTAEKQQAIQSKQQDYFGRLAYQAGKNLDAKPDDPLHARDTLLASVAVAAAHGQANEQEANDFVMRAAGANPGQIRAMIEQLVPPELRAKLDKEAADTAKSTSDAKKATAEAENISKYGRTTPPTSQQSTFRLDGKDVLGSYVPDATGGKYFHNGEDVTARVQHVPSAAALALNDPNALMARKNNAEQVVIGNMPPSMLSKRSSDYNLTLAEANKINIERTGKPLNLAKLETDYQAAKKFVATMNSGQMVRYRGLSESVVNTIDEVQRLGDLLQQGGVQKWNDVKRSTIRQVYGNTPESELANQYVGAVNTLKEEFANLANGGYAPTDSAWKLAHDQINADFGFRDLRASLTEVQRLINYRTQAFNDQKPYTGSQQPPAAPPQASAPVKVGGFTVTVRQ